jgi:hypothetical protein
MLIFVIPRTKNQSITVKGNNIALGFATASTQEGSFGTLLQSDLRDASDRRRQ